MAAQHTPGPWSFQANAAHGYRIRTSASTSSLKFGSGDIGVVFFAGSGRSAEQCKADARLIAAAPRLFDALETLTEAITTGAGRDFIEAFVRDASAALEEASPGWSKQDEPTARAMRQLGQVRSVATELLQVSTEMLELASNWPGVAYSADLETRARSAIATATRSQP